MGTHRQLGTLIKQGLRAYHGRPSERTSRFLAANLTRHLAATRVSRFTRATLTHYRGLRKREGASPATVNRELGLLRAILRAAEVPNLPINWGAEREKPRCRVLSEAEARDLLSWAPEWVSDVCMLLLGTGARCGEILGARVRDVTASAILVRSPKEGDPKVLVLTNGAQESAKRLRSRFWHPDSRAFGRPGKTHEQDYFALRYWMRRWAKQAGVEMVSPHDLRRTFGSWAIRSGATLEQVGQTLGHRDVRTTRRAYARLDEATSRSVAELVTGGLK